MIYFFYILILALIQAKWEIEIEGKYAWGIRLPTWRINNKWTKMIFDKELTGYHFWMLIIFLFLFHSPYLFISITAQHEYNIMGFYSLYWILEDFLWFVLSKYYGLQNFKKGRTYWHKHWFWGLPKEYWIGMLISGLLFYLGR